MERTVTFEQAVQQVTTRKSLSMEDHALWATITMTEQQVDHLLYLLHVWKEEKHD